MSEEKELKPSNVRFLGCHSIFGYPVAVFENLWPNIDRDKEFCMNREALKIRIINNEKYGIDNSIEKYALKEMERLEKIDENEV